ncbi:hypothetical protein RHGRI_030249 [Rhododendron griersonianum]|uniref:Uncharacterized protein n=1 Tax=Rhododendron griersonianum TaxID=479676 RepID=A0AAV6IMW5_9ERIC|nr:hypothetical protein RHGRI_030249 [Rhododendron griersonianum]
MPPPEPGEQAPVAAPELQRKPSKASRTIAATGTLHTPPPLHHTALLLQPSTPLAVATALLPLLSTPLAASSTAFTSLFCHHRRYTSEPLKPSPSESQSAINATKTCKKQTLTLATYIHQPRDQTPPPPTPTTTGQKQPPTPTNYGYCILMSSINKNICTTQLAAEFGDRLFFLA